MMATMIIGNVDDETGKIYSFMIKDQQATTIVIGVEICKIKMKYANELMGFTSLALYFFFNLSFFND